MWNYGRIYSPRNGVKVNDKEDIRIIKILSILAYSFLVLALLIILRTPTATSYEINIFNAYPWYFWMFIVLSIFTGSLALIKSAMAKTQNNYWISGFGVILLSNFILLTIPTIRNYLIFGRGDVLTHIGWIKYIIANGNFGSDIYPILHIIGAETYYFTGITVDSITMVIYPIFSIFYILSFYLLYNEVLKDKSKVILAMVFTSIMVMGTAHTSFAPYSLSLFVIPIFLYLYIKERTNPKWSFKLLLLIATLFLILFHPLTTVLMLLSIVIFEFSMYINIRLNKPDETYSKNFSYILIVLIITSLFLWKQYYYLIENGFATFYSFLVTGESPNLQNTLTLISKANFNDLIYSTIFIYGNWLIIFFASIISIYYLIKKNIGSTHLRNIFHIFSNLEVYEIFAVVGFLFFSIISILVYFKLQIFGFTRVVEFAIIFSNFLMFSLFYFIINNKNKILNNNNFGKILLISIIILPIICFSTLNLYQSPLELTPNAQVTSSEVNGIQTFFTDRNSSTHVLELGISKDRFYSAIYGEQADKYGQDVNILNLSNVSRTQPIDHFGFDNNTTLGKFYNNSVYLLINQIGFESYPVLYPGYQNIWRFTPQDFVTLNDSNQTMLIYNNGNLQIYKFLS